MATFKTMGNMPSWNDLVIIMVTSPAIRSPDSLTISVLTLSVPEAVDFNSLISWQLSLYVEERRMVMQTRVNQFIPEIILPLKGVKSDLKQCQKFLLSGILKIIILSQMGVECKCG